MKIAIFTEGTILMHQGGQGHSREEIVRQVEQGEPSVKDYAAYVPVAHAVDKVRAWARQDAEIIYMTSRRSRKEVDAIQGVLNQSGFPKGILAHRKGFEQYRHVAERIMPDILVEDDCESIGGIPEMTYPHIRGALQQRIKSIMVKEFGGIDHLPDAIELL